MDGKVILLAFFGFAAAQLVFRVLKNRGYKGALFGAPVRDVVGELQVRARGAANMTLKVHTLERNPDRDGPEVGIDISASPLAPWAMRPVALTAQQARSLAGLLSRAADAADAQGPRPNG